MLVMGAVTIMLPALSGLVTYKKNSRKSQHQVSFKPVPAADVPYTYTAPDADINVEDIVSSKTSALHDVRTKLGRLHAPKITEDDLPIKLELVGENELKKRVRGRKSGVSTINLDPAAYDYDVDDIIREELERDEEEKRQLYGKSEV